MISRREGNVSFETWIALGGAAIGVATLIVAILALTTWRSELRGASDHDLAKRLAGTLYQLRKARPNLLRIAQGRKPQNLAGLEFTFAHSQSLLTAVDAMEALELEAAAIWGPAIAGLVASIRNETATLMGKVSAMHSNNVFAGLSSIEGETGLYTMGKAFSDRLERLDELLRRYLEQYLRKRTLKLKVEDIEKLRARIDDAAKKAGQIESEEAEEASYEHYDENWAEYAELRRIEHEAQQRFDAIELPGGSKEEDSIVDIVKRLPTPNDRSKKRKRRETE